MSANAHQERPGREELGRVLMSAGALTPDWAPSFAAVPRGSFLPDLIWPWDMRTGRSVPVSRGDDPEAWYGYADADVPVVTQWDDGGHTGTEPGNVSTSSASMPSVVFRMLADLDVRPGHRVLEIGTGTGWNAALLAHRLGAENIVSVELDATVAAAARTALNLFGLPVRVVTRDGLRGHEEGAPYDRIIATCGLRSIPHAWVEQSRPGAVIVSPWGTHYSHGDAVARLVVAGDGGSASGLFTGPVEFMKARTQRQPLVPHAAYVTGSVADGEESSSTVTAEQLLGGRFSAQDFVIGLCVRDCVRVVADRDEGARAVWFYGLTDRSWACAQFRDHTSTRVWQSGPRRLWDEVEAALDWWTTRGRPGINRFGLTATPTGERTWLDDPNTPVPGGAMP
ncbi:methyltransferase domain-containing protein [Streptomyces sp. SDr-06]|uniref:methyltransferase domain-containing protein n=1 Tax=Streptomyces sp. SDr-06 TaxID=2267702 RepID=UPI000DE9B59B|nr:methyltransferase domain-containing protein [Streptomyces sp. SDr-06]RCH69309.1 methyltransferase domain-containing protein [Streptomyces sp. SDr-06]